MAIIVAIFPDNTWKNVLRVVSWALWVRDFLTIEKEVIKERRCQTGTEKEDRREPHTVTPSGLYFCYLGMNEVILDVGTLVSLFFFWGFQTKISSNYRDTMASSWCKKHFCQVAHSNLDLPLILTVCLNPFPKEQSHHCLPGARLASLPLLSPSMAKKSYEMLFWSCPDGCFLF